MPGISFICDFKEDLRNKENLILQSLDSLIHFEHYKKDILINEKSYFLGCTLYDGYPMTSFENDNFIMYIEGKIYNNNYSIIERKLIKLAQCIYEEEISIEQLKMWLLDTDGEFIIIIVNKRTNEISLINDAFGLLPLYFIKLDHQIILSREIRFITNLTGSKDFDRMALAQYLLFGYALGKRTLIKNISRVRPATLIKINLNSRKIDIIKIHEFNVQEKEYEKVDIEENTKNLIGLFSEACNKRACSYDDYSIILSLSGGLDSRAVGACLKKNDIRFSGVSYLDSCKRAKDDVEIAAQLAKVFKIDWSLFELENPKDTDILKLLKIKNGQNHLGMSFILSFLDRIKERYGSKIIYFTGVGGGILKPEMRLSKKLRNINELIDFVIKENHVFKLERVSSLTRLKENEIINELKDHFLSYPEKDYSQKYVHFLVYELDFKWALEGEDRNRFYYWSVAPFYSIPFFNYIINCPDNQISEYKLYRLFLSGMYPDVLAIDYANWNAPISSIKAFLIKLYHKSPSSIRSVVRRALKPDKSIAHADANLVSSFKKQINNCEAVNKYLSIPYVSSILKHCNRHQIESIFTLTSIIEDFECGTTSINSDNRK